MSQNVLITIGIVVVILLVLLLHKKSREKVGGMYAFMMGQAVKKDEYKEKILALLAEKGEVTNMDIEKALKIPERTIVRYMDELEEENKVEQVGKTGRSVIYRLKR